MEFRTSLRGAERAENVTATKARCDLTRRGGCRICSEQILRLLESISATCNPEYMGLYRKIRNVLFQIEWAVTFSYPIARIPWSVIRRIGQSKILSLTILVPFIGALLLFNQHFVELFSLSPRLFSSGTALTPDAEARAATATLSRLYYMYFGLSFLGMGSALFALFCPLEISTHASAREYIETESSLVSKARMGLILPRTAEAYRYFAADGYVRSLTRRLSHPTEFTSLFDEVAKELFATPRNTAPGEDDDLDLYDDRARFDPYKFARIVASRQPFHLGFNIEIQEASSLGDNKRNVLTLHYMAIDHSKPWLRTIITSFYGIGFAILLWPTALTFLQIASQPFAR